MGVGMEVPELMTAQQVARLLGVSTETLRKWRAKRKCLPFVRVGAAHPLQGRRRGRVRRTGHGHARWKTRKGIGMGVPVIYTDFDDEDGGRAARGGHVGL